MKVINLIGGAGCGKSILASGLFYQMKLNGYNVELIREWIKSAVYEDRKLILSDGLYILAKQNKLLRELEGRTEYVICDSPLFLPAIYQRPFNRNLEKFTVELYKSYDNIDILVNRNENIPYEQVGRFHTFEEACRIDKEIKMFFFEKIKPFFDLTVCLDSNDSDSILFSRIEKLIKENCIG